MGQDGYPGSVVLFFWIFIPTISLILALIGVLYWRIEKLDDRIVKFLKPYRD